MLLVLLVGACSSGDALHTPSPSIEFNPTPTPDSSTPVQPIDRSPTPVVEPTTQLTSPIVAPIVPIDISTLAVPVCRTSVGNALKPGFGTIPHATPTAIPSSDSTGSSAGAAELAMVSALKPLVEATSSLATSADRSHKGASDREDVARAVFFEGRRLSVLCGSLELIPLTLEAEGFVNGIADALIDRRSVLVETAELVRDESADVFALHDQLETSAARLVSLVDDLNVFAESNSVLSVDAAPFTVVNPLIGVTFDVPAGWLAARNGVDIVLIAPADRQDYSVRGVGPSSWKLGTALRVRRFRNATPVEISEAAATLDALYVLFGSRADDQAVSIGAVPGVLRVYADNTRAWSTFVGATVSNDSTYLFEFGCPDEFAVECEVVLKTILESVGLENN
jgi:hypothetical protein